MPDIKVRGLLLDLGGVVFTGDRLLPGVPEAIERLRQSGLPLRFLTNTTRRSLRRLVADLCRAGLELEPEQVLTPAQLARRRLVDEGLTLHLLAHESLEDEFADLSAGDGEAVVIGDAGERFTYGAPNAAYRRLEAGATFLALATNRRFHDSDGQLSRDAGPFIRALEYASGREATVLGKPSPEFFRLALAALGAASGETVMIGDNAEADVAGAMAVGLVGVLVQTGKYAEGDAARLDQPPSYIAGDLTAAVDWILPRAPA